MQFSALYDTLNNNANLEKKLLSNFFYSKFLVYSTNKFGVSIENSLFAKNTKFFSKFYKNKKKLSGCSLNVKMYSFKNKRQLACSFYGPLSEKTGGESIKQFNGAFSIQNQTPILIHSAVKGGFRVYSLSGVVGFLPKTQIQKVYKSLNFLAVLKLLAKVCPSSNTFFIWLFCKLAIVKIRAVRYVLRKKRKRKIYSNFLFLNYNSAK